MLVYQAHIQRRTKYFSTLRSAQSWVELNSEPGTWRENTTDLLGFMSDSNGSQMGVVVFLVVETGDEKDPIRNLAFKILNGDPMALDAARDILKY